MENFKKGQKVFYIEILGKYKRISEVEILSMGNKVMKVKHSESETRDWRIKNIEFSRYELFTSSLEKAKEILKNN